MSNVVFLFLLCIYFYFLLIVVMQMADKMDRPPDLDNDQYCDDIFSSTSKGQQVLSDDLPPLETVRKMIQYETLLRLSDPIQQLFDLYHKEDNAVT
jgi:hypothetical protein